MKRLVSAAVLLAVLVFLEWQLEGWVGQYPYQVASLVGINIILAVSLNLINGFTGQFSIGHAGFFAVGAYASAAFAVYMEAPVRSLTGPLPALLQNAVLLLLGIAVAAVVSGVAGLLVGIPSLRLRGDYLAIVTLGFGEIIRVLIVNIDAIGGARGFTGIPQISNFFWVYLAVAVTVVAIRNLMDSSFGRAFISIRDDEIAAEAMGVNTTKFKVLAFVISSMFAGVAGSLFAHYTGFLHPNTFLFTTSFNLIIMIVVGGLGSIEGAFVGAVMVTAGLEVMRDFREFRLVAFSIALILFMIYRPEGLLGSWTVSKVLRRFRAAKPAEIRN